ncbi:hypothetical protein DFP73DRAFT_590291 [Morchella snyderi]|nr:hypothetical protein DFP73DRAFT_590291 [Morchella snyderi]
MATKNLDPRELASELKAEQQRNGEGMETFPDPELYDEQAAVDRALKRLATNLRNHSASIGIDLGLIERNEQSLEAGLDKFRKQTEEQIPELIDPDDQRLYDKAKLQSSITAGDITGGNDKALDPLSNFGIEYARDDDTNFDTHYSDSEDESSGDEEGFVSLYNTIKVDFEVSSAGSSNILHATIARTGGLDVIHIVDLKERTIKFITARRSIENPVIGNDGIRGLIIGMSAMALPGRYEWAMGRVIDDGQKSGVWKCVWPALEHQLPEEMREQTVDIVLEEGDYSVKDWDWDIGVNNVPGWLGQQTDKDWEMGL